MRTVAPRVCTLVLFILTSTTYHNAIMQAPCKINSKIVQSLKILHHTSPQGQDILDAECFRLLQMLTNNLLRLVSTSDMKHRLQAAVVESCTCYSHGASFPVTARVTRWMPRDITEEGTAGKHSVKPVYQVCRTSSCLRWEELEGEETTSAVDSCLCRCRISGRKKKSLTQQILL